MIIINTPIDSERLRELNVGDTFEISGFIITGRDAVLPKLAQLYRSNQLDNLGIDLNGSAIFHTAVSSAGIGPTSSNKVEIEENIPILSKAGVKIHLGKGELSDKTVQALAEYGSIYAVVAPVTALLQSTIISKKVLAFENEGMEALHLLQVKNFPAVVAIAHGNRLN